MKLSVLLSAALAALALVPAAPAAEPVKLTLGAGCFWCVEAVYEKIEGVSDVVSGYAGGKEQNPTYEQVGDGRTGHAECVQITFDPDVVSLDKLLDIYWKSHDATDGTGVKPDFGRQYRPILFYNDEAMQKTMLAAKERAQKDYSKPIATEIVPFEKFWPAEEYHQDFVKKHPNHPYVLQWSVPKLRKLGLDQPGKKKL